MASSRRGKVQLHNEFVGVIEQKEDEFIFTYNPEYLETKNPAPVSVTLPVRPEPYRSKTMIPFFDGLIPEGWLLDISAKTWKVAANDRMGLLLTVCRDCIGAVSILGEDKEE